MHRRLEIGLVVGTVVAWIVAVSASVCGVIPTWAVYTMAPILPLAGWPVSRSLARKRDAEDPLRPWRCYQVIDHVRMIAAGVHEVVLELRVLKHRDAPLDGALLRFEGVQAFTMFAAWALGAEVDHLQCRRIWDSRLRCWLYRVQDRSGACITFTFRSLDGMSYSESGGLTAQHGTTADERPQAGALG